MSTTTPITTAPSLLEWVTITGEGKENLSGKLQYVANAVVEANDPVIAEIEAFWKANKPQGFTGQPKSLGIYPHKTATDEKDENGKTVFKEDGKLYLAFKTGTTYADGSAKEIKIYNAKGRRAALPEGTTVGNGTVGAVQGAMGIYTTKSPKGGILTAGVTLYLNAIKIHKLEAYKGAEAFEEDDTAEGWTGEDDSWEGETSAAPESAKGAPRL